MPVPFRKSGGSIGISCAKATRSSLRPRQKHVTLRLKKRHQDGLPNLWAKQRRKAAPQAGCGPSVAIIANPSAMMGGTWFHDNPAMPIARLVWPQEAKMKKLKLPKTDSI